jgi:hypothetical protein
MPRGVAQNTRSCGESAARQIHQIVKRGVTDERLEAEKQKWIGAVLDQRPVGVTKGTTYRYVVSEVYRDDLKRLIAVAYRVENENE